nr:Chain B, Epitope peptide (mutation T6A) [Homo sapiens]5YD4_D Chain D, Epitope peptide (mutation T6A) [Homo sapiens]5YD4_F Chain F, Epitope peptide (mutation T6A) [Homo sapiens]5YD4_H Chain H, Epitope peptide (mutation T6A) [Homo sapiens]
DINYYASEP